MFKKINICLILSTITTLCFASPSNQISIPNNFSPQTIISSSQVNANFNEIQSKFNNHTHTDITQLGVVTTGTWAATPIQSSYVAQGAGAITGEVKIWAGTTANIPSSFLSCDGSAVSRTTYSSLFTIIGTQYGIGDGSTTFNLPNWNNNLFVRGSTTAGTSGGADTHNHGGSTGSYTLQVADVPGLTYTVSADNGATPSTSSFLGRSGAALGTFTGTTSGGGGGHSHTISTSNNIPAYQTGIYIIKT